MHISQQDGRIIFDFYKMDQSPLDSALIKTSPLRPFFADYAIICDNFYTAARGGEIYRLETLDAGRKALHDEAAESLMSLLSPVLLTDLPTARRLFTLIYVLHMRDINL